MSHLSSLSAPEAPYSPQLSIDMKEHVQYTCKRHITLLFKECLDITKQIAEEHEEALDKLFDVLPPEYQAHLYLADHFTPDKRERIRKAILARGNDCVRAVEMELAKYQMTLGGDQPYDSDDRTVAVDP